MKARTYAVVSSRARLRDGEEIGLDRNGWAESGSWWRF
jgi:hypothetical protein